MLNPRDTKGPPHRNHMHPKNKNLASSPTELKPSSPSLHPVNSSEYKSLPRVILFFHLLLLVILIRIPHFFDGTSRNKIPLPLQVENSIKLFERVTPVAYLFRPPTPQADERFIAIVSSGTNISAFPPTAVKSYEVRIVKKTK